MSPNKEGRTAALGEDSPKQREPANIEPQLHQSHKPEKEDTDKIILNLRALQFAKWRENCLFHEVVTFRIPANYTPDWVKVETQLFLGSYGLDSSGKTLAIINYGGHGDHGLEGLNLCSHRSGGQSLDWSVIEDPVTQATSGILIMLDRCHAGNFIKSTLGRTPRPGPSARAAQRIEVLGACHAGQSTWASGVKTHTYRLAKVMAKLRHLSEDMSTETINHEIYKLYHSAKENFDPFQLTIKKGYR
ncbi:hypothetical protein FKW77_001424 [Venturia effusa]|uniref:Uncharacterized protein n=1 Tax=Venturia effusa TaxID=50376 RepID=A0A517L2S1_9PEZI|nr:hypothetical protein FKW77_001424 [Venturia effusa]